MKLKRLEIQGFKSFADRTIIQFEQSITGVVGPNGCGKSNIVDAIRWVMGEMSAKHLRGQAMQDVIFAGSDTRPAAGMAEVTLVLSNEGGVTPSAYSSFTEISVTRRLFRTGDSEYLLNKVPCRLYDIYDLFLGTGVGTKAYSIVEQGQIGQIILSKPEDRRKIIEEAAGISKFKARKEAALRKMEATQGNLTRLEDILKELTRQLSSLDRQAKKAERYKVIKDQAREIELHLASHDYLNWQENFSLEEQTEKTLAEQEAVASAKLSQSELELETLKLTLTQEEQEFSSLQEKLYQKNNSVRLHEQGIQYKKREIQLLQERIESAGNELESLEGQKIQADAELAQTLASQTKTEEEFQVSRQNLVAEEEKVRHEEEQHRLLEQQIQAKEKNLLDSVRLMLEAKNRHESCERQKLEIQQKLEKNLLESENLEAQLKKINPQQKNLEEQIAQLKQFKLNLQSEKEALHNQLQSLRQSIQDLKKNIGPLKDTLHQKRSRLHSLQEIQKNFEGYQEGVKKLLSSHQGKERFQKFLGTVADFLEISPEYQKALSAALGDQLQSIVIDEITLGVEAIEWLQTQKAGRAAFILPFEQKKDTSTGPDLQEKAGVLGLLKNFVQWKTEYQFLESILFHNVWIIEDLKTALILYPTLKTACTLVTLNGEVLNERGILSGGSPENQTLSILEKKQEIKTLTETVKTLDEQVKTQDYELLQSEKTVEKIQSALEKIQKDAHQEELQLVTLEKDLSHLKVEHQRLSQRKNQLATDNDQLNQQQENLSFSLTELLEQTSLQQQEKIVHETALDQLKTSLQQEQRKVFELREVLTRKKIAVESIETQRAQLLREIEKNQKNQIHLQNRLQECNRLKLEGSEKTQSLQEEIQGSEEALKYLVEEVRELNADHVALKNLLETHQRDHLQKEAHLKELRKNHDQLKTALNTSVLHLSELRNQLQRLKEQIFERYQTEIAVVAQDYREKLLEDRPTQELNLKDLKEQLSKIGEVNLSAIDEYHELKVRHDFLKLQAEDLTQSLESLSRVIQKIHKTTRTRFQATFDAVNAQFQELFPKLFRGGKARLVMTDENNLLETGVEIVAQPPGKKLQSISLLSGGEKALTAVSLIFAIFLFKPSPFCILDEVDAPLDDANIDRFNELVRSMTDRSQFILITHSKRTMELADVLYGITMAEPGVSRTVSVKLNEMAEVA